MSAASALAKETWPPKSGWPTTKLSFWPIRASCGKQGSRCTARERLVCGLRDANGLRYIQLRPALWDALFGNRGSAAQSAMEGAATSSERYVQYGAAFALALAGDSARSEAISTSLEARFSQDTGALVSYIPAVRAQLALNRGDALDALNLLQTTARMSWERRVSAYTLRSELFIPFT